MPKCTADKIEFGKLGRRADRGRLQRRGAVQRRGHDAAQAGRCAHRADAAAAAVLSDPRDPLRIVHSMRDLLAQRIYGLCCGHEDLNDHDRLRDDVLMQTALGRVDALASSPTLSRLETRATQAQAWPCTRCWWRSSSPATRRTRRVWCSISTPRTSRCTATRSCASSTATTIITATCRCMCSAARRCWPGYLRRSRIDGAKNATALIKLLIARLRQAWPRCRSSCGPTRAFAASA